MDPDRRRILFDKDPAVIEARGLMLLYSPRHKGWYWGRKGSSYNRPVCKAYSCDFVPAKIDKRCSRCEHKLTVALLQESLFSERFQVFNPFEFDEAGLDISVWNLGD